jgi:hypothetical protein
MATFKRFGEAAAAQNPGGLIVMKPEEDGSVTLFADGTTMSCTIPKDVINRARISNPGFDLSNIPKGGAPAGLNASGLLNLLNVMTWGIHEPNVLIGTVKGMASMIYLSDGAP